VQELNLRVVPLIEVVTQQQIDLQPLDSDADQLVI